MKKVFGILLAGSSIFAKHHDFNDVKTINAKLFSYHVIFDGYNEMLAERSVNKILTSFDPVDLYFLESEKNIFKSSSKVMVEEYNSGTFTTYIKIQETFEVSVKRCRRIRAGVRSDIIYDKIDYNAEWMRTQNGAPESELEQKKNIRAYMVSHLQAYAASRGLQSLDQKEKMRVLDYYERRMQAHEERFLSKEIYPLVVSKMIASSLDAHSMVYGEEEITNINSHLKSRFEGIGIYIGDGIDGPVITGCVKGGPAERSEMIQPGDRITYVNGVNASEVSFTKVMNLLSVKDGGQIILHVESKEGKQKMVKLTGEKITMKKDKIVIETESFLDGQIAKLSIDTFYNDFEGNDMSGDLKNVIVELKKQKPLYGVIIDMRQNLGGFFKEAVKSIALFSPQKTVVVAKFRDDQVRYSTEFNLEVAYCGPIVILTSKYSASAAEILAQSLQDVGLAIIAGDESSFGKGSIQFQTITDPNSEHKYKVTVGKYYTVSGTSTQLKGVSADIIVPSIYSKRKIGEKYLTYALPSGDLSKGLNHHPEVKEVFDYQSRRKKTAYEIMKPHLKKNSELRLKNNKNYQAFLKSLDEKPLDQGLSMQEKKKAKYGSNDLQMAEATYIIKDMHSILKSYE